MFQRRLCTQCCDLIERKQNAPGKIQRPSREHVLLDNVIKLNRNQTLTELRRNTEDRLDNERIAREIDGFSNAAEKALELDELFDTL